MLLNEFGQPERSNAHMPQDAPLLVSGEIDLNLTLVPRGWRGTMYTSDKIFKQVLQTHHIEWRPSPVCILEENLPSLVQLPFNELLELTLIPIAADCTGHRAVFLAKDNYVLNLFFFGKLRGYMDALLRNVVLREAIKEGIDVLHIGDNCFPEANDYAQEDVFELRRLVLLVRPKKVLNIHGTKMPSWVMELCKKDLLQDLNICAEPTKELC